MATGRRAETVRFRLGCLWIGNEMERLCGGQAYGYRSDGVYSTCVPPGREPLPVPSLFPQLFSPTVVTLDKQNPSNAPGVYFSGVAVYSSRESRT